MAGKMLLPLLGGSPSVWNISMLFFQGVLLAGYGYAHILARFLSLHAQAVIHTALLALFTVFLPLALPDNAAPPAANGQAYWQLGVMLACIGGPFFILAASAPLFQHWFASSGHEDAQNPYFLYAISNAGSLGALLSYPFIIEPLLGLMSQTRLWFGFYCLLLLLVVLCAIAVRRGEKPRPSGKDGDARTTIPAGEKALWVFLAFVPSSLMLGVTTIITTDLASAPLLWVIPLALYLASFIAAFARKPFIRLETTRELAAIMLSFLVLLFILKGYVVLNMLMIAVHLTGFFLFALFCHQALAAKKPHPSRLTEYFLLISFGGVLGGAFNALLAPALFSSVMEYGLALSLIAALLVAGALKRPSVKTPFTAADDKKRIIKSRILDGVMIAAGIGLCRAIFMVESGTLAIFLGMGLFVILILSIPNKPVFGAVAIAALLSFQNPLWNVNTDPVYQTRNYFGVVRVHEKDGAHYMYHGTTLHGAQLQAPEYRHVPLTYYSPGGPASDLFALHRGNGQNEPATIAALGLGVGSVTCLAQAADKIVFYEIDQDIVDLAQDPDYFSYLSGCGPVAEVVTGDARLKIEEEADGLYDLILLDAFSSDNIPVHLLTREAFATYTRKLADGGVIGVNISNRHMDFRPMLAALAQEAGLYVYFKYHQPERSADNPPSLLYTASSYAALSKNHESIAPLVENHDWQPSLPERGVKSWTDDYANLLSVLVRGR